MISRALLGVLSNCALNSSFSGRIRARVNAAGSVIPVPLRLTVCGLPVALVATVSVPAAAPAAAGANVTLIVQVVAAAKEAGQLVLCAKPAPLTPTLAMLSAAPPLLVRAMLCTGLGMPISWLPKLTTLGVSLTAGAPTATPLPESGTAWGLPLAFELMVIDALRAPNADGVNTAPAVQLACGARLVPAAQLPLNAKSPALAPPSATLLSVSAAEPVFVTVTDLAVLGVLSNWSPNASDAADKPIAGVGAFAPVPLNATELGLPVAL